MSFQTALIGIGVVGVVGAVAAWKFVTDAREAVAVARRPKQPWDW